MSIHTCNGFQALKHYQIFIYSYQAVCILSLSAKDVRISHLLLLTVDNMPILGVENIKSDLHDQIQLKFMHY